MFFVYESLAESDPKTTSPFDSFPMVSQPKEMLPTKTRPMKRYRKHVRSQRLQIAQSCFSSSDSVDEPPEPPPRRRPPRRRRKRKGPKNRPTGNNINKRN